MKTITVLIALLLMATTAYAFPDMPWANNPDICKVQITNVDGSMVGVYTWFNNDTGLWEARIGVDTWATSAMMPGTSIGDSSGLVKFNLMEMTRGYY